MWLVVHGGNSPLNEEGRVALTDGQAASIPGRGANSSVTHVTARIAILADGIDDHPHAAGLVTPSLLIGLRAHLEQRPACSAYEVARRFGMSLRTFQRRLRQLDTSFQQEINAAHLRIAKRLMQETDKPLKWIAIESGYASLQHFSSSFRARVGLSPGAWRAGTSTAKQAR
ncbi:MAG TPA: helix-turn-helix transcriptional regulator [Terriglobia bacterium]|nr:helix-turn-helix transcriptional regulator [Terriglobia bacterium]